MNNKYPHLFTPCVIRGKLFRNRILAGPLGYNEGNPEDGSMALNNIKFYAEIAAGGAARVVGGGDCVVTEDGGYMGGMDRLKFYKDPISMNLPGSIKTYVNQMHGHGALAFVQFIHGGFDPEAEGPGFQCTTTIDSLTKEHMDEITQGFARCVSLAKYFGLDGCIIHAGHCKLIDQFRARDFNHRTDEYGGSLENRCRYPIEILKAIREAAGDDFIVELRMSIDEHVEGGITIEETIEFLKMLDDLGYVDIFHCSAGRHTHQELNCWVTSPGIMPQAPNRAECRMIKDAGIKTPLAIVNSVSDPEVAESILAEGDADFVVMSRQLNLADPYYPRKLQEGHEELINNCIRCHGCYDACGPCSVNPLATYFTAGGYPIAKAVTSRKVCIVGGGIGGMKAAEIAADRGHQVILFEKDDALGGQLRFSDTDVLKTDIRRYKTNMIKRLEDKANVEIRLSTEATPEMVSAEKPDAVIVAIGPVQKKPNIAGVTGKNVLSIMDAYRYPERVGDNVVMVGSGLSGCETTLHLCFSGKKVTVLGRSKAICAHENFNEPPTSAFSPIPVILRMFEENGVELHNNCACTEIFEGGVKAVENGEEKVFPCDTVILGSGMQARQEDAMKFADCAPFFRQIGDCVKPSKVRMAVYQGYWAAMDI